jgi:16S rRNA (cytidine1402-2'-O)-methyltransferase
VALYLVGTPIGNMGDISERARAVLAAVDVVASEDTRHTGRLLARLGLRKPQISFHAFNERQAVARLMGLLRAGRDVALVSDAGTPGIADPGFSLVRAAAAASIPVTMVPGPCALIAALVLSALPAHAFTFRGFPPRRRAARLRFLREDAAIPHTLVYYESPHRLAAFLEDARTALGDRPAAVCLELTKRFERVRRGRLGDLAAAAAAERVRGEVTVVIGGAPRAHRAPAARAPRLQLPPGRPGGQLPRRPRRLRVRGRGR